MLAELPIAGYGRNGDHDFMIPPHMAKELAEQHAIDLRRMGSVGLALRRRRHDGRPGRGDGRRLPSHSRRLPNPSRLLSTPSRRLSTNSVRLRSNKLRLPGRLLPGRLLPSRLLTRRGRRLVASTEGKP
jgi:hypothetical protein